MGILVDFALQFDGSQSYVSLGTMGNFGSNLGSGFYCKFAIVTTQTTQGKFGIRHSGYSGVNEVNIGFNTGVNEGAVNHSLSIYIASNNYSYELFKYTSSPTINFNDGALHTIEIIVNVSARTVVINIDGISQTLASSFSTRNTPNWINFVDAFYLAADNDSSSVAHKLTCTLDNFQIGTSPTNLYGSYPGIAQLGSGTTLKDVSGQGNNGTLTGSPLPLWIKTADYNIAANANVPQPNIRTNIRTF